MIMNMLPAFKRFPKQVVAIELGLNAIRVVKVKKEGERAVVLSSARIERSGEDVFRNMGKLLKGNGEFRGPGIIVTDQVKFLAGELNMGGAEKLSDDKLNAAARWEIEPYLDFPPSDGLFTCQLQPYLARENNIPVLISAIKRTGYSGFSDLLKDCGIDLRRVYSPEGALAFASGLPADGKNKVIIDYRKTSIKGVCLTEKGPSVFQDLPIVAGAAAADEPVRNMIYDLTASAGGAQECVITGSAVSEELIHGLKTELENVRIWGLEDFGGVDFDQAVTDFGPGYALAVGAALQEIGLAGEGLLGVTDRVSVIDSVTQRLSEYRRLIPAFAIGLFLLIVAGHYVMTSASISQYASKIKQLKVEKQKLLGPLKEKESLSRRLTDLIQKKEYLEKILPALNRNVLNLFAAISDSKNIPVDVVLNRVNQKNDGSFSLEGNAMRGRSIIDFNRVLSKLESCEATVLEKVNRVENPSNIRKKILPYDFIINVRFQLRD